MRRLAVALLLTVTVAGCGSLQSYEGERTLNRREIAPGPGLFSGPAGGWTLVHRTIPGSTTPEDHETDSPGIRIP